MVSSKSKIMSVIHHAVGILLGFLMIYPLLWMLMSSFKDNNEIFVDAYSLWPKTWAMIENYTNGWKGAAGVGFGKMLFNSLLVTLLGTAFNILSSLAAAAALSRVRFKGASFWFGCVILTMMVPQQVMVVPQYIIFNKMGLTDTYFALIAPWMFGGAFFIFLMLQFFRGIPKELDEAAAIDGCSKLGTIIWILIPNVLPAIVTSAIFSFYWIWQDFFQPLIFVNDPNKYTVALGLKLFLDPTSASDYGSMLAMSVVSLMPIIIFFVIFQKNLVEGVTTSGLKG